MVISVILAGEIDKTKTKNKKDELDFQYGQTLLNVEINGGPQILPGDRLSGAGALSLSNLPIKHEGRNDKQNTNRAS